MKICLKTVKPAKNHTGFEPGNKYVRKFFRNIDDKHIMEFFHTDACCLLPAAFLFNQQ
jgi:hypothetical protein